MKKLIALVFSVTILSAQTLTTTPAGVNSGGSTPVSVASITLGEIQFVVTNTGEGNITISGQIGPYGSYGYTPQVILSQAGGQFNVCSGCDNYYAPVYVTIAVIQPSTLTLLASLGTPVLLTPIPANTIPVVISTSKPRFTWYGYIKQNVE